MSGSARSKPLMLDVPVPSEDLSYRVRVGDGLLSRLGPEVRRAQDGVRRVALVSDETVARLHGDTARASLQAEGLQVSVHVLAPGEASKRPDVVVGLVEGMVEAGLSRRDVVVTLGGGVVGDVGGLAAALFMRGIGYVQCPTTLLAQVDASVGGKVAVDLAHGKNLLGAFHFPRAVVIDTEVLATLPDVEIACGLAEMIKHGLLFDASHFEQVVGNTDAVYGRSAAILARLVAHSVALKAACVSRDPLELGSSGKGRILLNLGHTLGHAIEHASGFGMRHGEAVALGLVAAARVSERKGVARVGLQAQVCDALTRARLSTDLDAWLVGERGEAVERALLHDKKRDADRLTFVALAGVADPSTLSLHPQEIMGLLRPAAAH